MSELDGETSLDSKSKFRSDNAGVFLLYQKVALTIPGVPLSTKKSRTVRKGSRSRAVDKLAGEGLPVVRGTEGSRVALSTSFQGNARGSGGPGKEATECICPTRALNHPGNFSVDNWLPMLEPNGWLTRFNVPSLPRENDMVASEAATSVTNHVIFIASVYR